MVQIWTPPEVTVEDFNKLALAIEELITRNNQMLLVLKRLAAENQSHSERLAATDEKYENLQKVFKRWRHDGGTPHSEFEPVSDSAE